MMKDNRNADEYNDEQDSIIDAKESNAVGAIVQRNAKIIIVASIAIIILVGLILLFKSNNAKKEQNATMALSRIENYYFEGRFEDALYAPDSLPTVRGDVVIGLIKIVNEYGSTKAGERAALFAGDAYYQLGKYSESQTYFEKAIQSKVDEVKIGGYAGVASCNERDGKLKDAAANYNKAASMISDDGLSLRYFYFSGLCYEKVGEKDKAKEIYQNIINKNKFGEFNNYAKAGLVRLGGEVD